MARRDPAEIMKRIILGIWGIVVIVCSGIAVTACFRGVLVHNDTPLMLVGVIGGLMGLAGGFYITWIAMRGRAAYRRA